MIMLFVGIGHGHWTCFFFVSRRRTVLLCNGAALGPIANGHVCEYIFLLQFHLTNQMNILHHHCLRVCRVHCHRWLWRPLCISPLPRIFMYVYCPQCRFYIIQMVKCLGDVSGLKNNGNNAWKRPANQLSLWANMFLYSIRHRVNCAVRNDCVEKCCPVFCFVACDRSLSIAFAFLTFSFYLRHGITMMPSYTAHNIYIHKQSKSRVSYCFSFFFYAVVVKRLLQYGKSVAKWSAVLVRCAMQ